MTIVSMHGNTQSFHDDKQRVRLIMDTLVDEIRTQAIDATFLSEPAEPIESQSEVDMLEAQLIQRYHEANFLRMALFEMADNFLNSSQVALMLNDPDTYKGMSASDIQAAHDNKREQDERLLQRLQNQMHTPS